MENRDSTEIQNEEDEHSEVPRGSIRTSAAFSDFLFSFVPVSCCFCSLVCTSFLQPIEVKVTGLDSTKNVLHRSHYSLPFCRPKGGIRPSQETLGEMLSGDVVENTDYQVCIKSFPRWIHCSLI